MGMLTIETLMILGLSRQIRAWAKAIRLSRTMRVTLPLTCERGKLS
jgi:hypothetical protein